MRKLMNLVLLASPLIAQSTFVVYVATTEQLGPATTVLPFQVTQGGRYLVLVNVSVKMNGSGIFYVRLAKRSRDPLGVGEARCGGQ